MIKEPRISSCLGCKLLKNLTCSIIRLNYYPWHSPTNDKYQPIQPPSQAPDFPVHGQSFNLCLGFPEREIYRGVKLGEAQTFLAVVDEFICNWLRVSLKMDESCFIKYGSIFNNSDQKFWKYKKTHFTAKLLQRVGPIETNHNAKNS